MKIRKSELKEIIREVLSERKEGPRLGQGGGIQELGSGRKDVGFDKDTAGTKKWMKMADKYYKNIVSNIGRFPHSAHALRLAKALKTIDVETSRDLTKK
jgi:hypothetical protein|tara:strand:+ start:28 stop:324 length:297 start_codon:yes stop_codon:yes gene_type:complete